ncbi:MAG: glycosyltransferase [Ectothiorhodospiraceae bacterium]|nr:glycosyltransferase [Ectothiorhodospiraceae bacterium]
MNREFVFLSRQLLTLYTSMAKADHELMKEDVQAWSHLLRRRVEVLGCENSRITYERYARLMALRLDASKQALAPTSTTISTTTQTLGGRLLPELTPTGKPGISLVTCCMNRTENLLKALKSWLVADDISEIIIVDWSSKESVDLSIKEAGIRDGRIRVVRVEGEPRWILSYAFNLGFRLCVYDKILKVDADIVLSDLFFEQNSLEEKAFIAGNWRSADADQAYVNGFFLASKKALYEVGGFNEYITTYGWDDDDLYGRLERIGYRRKDVAPGSVYHLSHADEVRTGLSGKSAPLSLREALLSDPAFLIRRNFHISNLMPPWQGCSAPVQFRILSDTGSDIIELRRLGLDPNEVPAHIRQKSTVSALREVVAKRLGGSVWQLSLEQLNWLLERPASCVSDVDVQISRIFAGKIPPANGNYLVLKGLRRFKKRKELVEIVTRAAILARKQNLTPVLAADAGQLPADLRNNIPAISELTKLPELKETTLMQLAVGSVPVDDGHLSLSLDSEVSSESVVTTPMISVSRRRIFIDAQHGLGNRLRALASAASIAQRSESELVIVWEPDHHCDCLFSDLFDYKGAVVESRFLEQAGGLGCRTYNYMTVEADAEKGAQISLEGRCDIYARSAFVLNSRLTSWNQENAFLRSLEPVDEVKALVSSVRRPNDVSAHIRMEGGRKDEHLPYESPDNWSEEDHDLIDYWRSKSHFSHFMRRIDQLIAKGGVGRLFLAADRPETYVEFQKYYGDHLTWLPRDVFDRSAVQLRYALADAILLGDSPVLLGSTWSSFSELATRLSCRDVTVEMSGKDF